MRRKGEARLRRRVKNKLKHDVIRLLVHLLLRFHHACIQFRNTYHRIARDVS